MTDAKPGFDEVTRSPPTCGRLVEIVPPALATRCAASAGSPLGCANART